MACRGARDCGFQGGYVKGRSQGIAGILAVIASALVIFGAGGMMPQPQHFNVARLGSSAVFLPDGRVVLAGGMTDGRVSQSLENFNPATGTFNFAGNMTAPRSGHAAAVLADGRVLIAGGSFSGVAPSDTTDIFNPESGEVTSG